MSWEIKYVPIEIKKMFFASQREDGPVRGSSVRREVKLKNFLEHGVKRFPPPYTHTHKKKSVKGSLSNTGNRLFK